EMGDQWTPSIWSASSLHLPPSSMASLIPIPFSGAPPSSGDLIKLEKSEPTDSLQSTYGTEGFGPSSGQTGATPYDPSFFPSMQYPGGSGHSSDMGGETFKQQKAAIFSHPLFPLLTCLFEKCELATCTPRDSSREGTNDVVSALSFNEDLEQFKKTMETQKAYYTPNKVVDDYMIEYIAMLRFHLMEVEKVHELCDNFCQRYVTCLKGKMPMDIVGEERASSSQMSPGGSPGMNTPMNHYQAPSAPPYEPQTVPLPESSMPHGLESLGGMASSSYGLTPLGVSSDGLTSSSSSMLPLAMDGSLLAVGGHSSHSNTQAAPLSMSHPPPMGPSPTLHPLHSVPSPSASSSGGNRNASTPLFDSSIINPNPASIDSTETGDESSSMCGSNEDGRESVTSDCTGGGKRKVPKVFSKEAITKFRSWLFQHLTHPYPSEEQKKQLANETGLTILQVNNWFINARRRIVQPMIDQSNRAGRGGPQVNSFRGRRRERDSSSPPTDNGATPINPNETTPYSPDVASSVAPPMVYPSGDLSYMRQSLSFPYPSFNPSMATPFMMPSMLPSATFPWPIDGLGTANITQMD
ncbi:hypothetical protein PMAYCL1PPCAC_29495, partial [Pristionchus mayeri]